MGELQSTRQDYDRFKAAVAKGDLSQAQRLLSQLKLKLIQLTTASYESASQTQAARALFRDVLEQAIFLSVKSKDEEAFQRNYVQLQEHYLDTRSVLPASPLQDLVLGLNLLRLLVQNSIAEFHTELELLSPKMQRSPYVAQATQLEQWLMEGAFNKVLDAGKAAPDPAYAYFLDKLQTTIRDEIASCSEQAYPHLSVKDATNLMMFNSEADLAAYAQQRAWSIDNGQLVFQVHEEDKISEVPAVQLIQHAMTYARELERIV
ncbi:hypothetical protein WJX73_002846 [Symbiochloris irregularis]|uniref:PCI domain-containing protein n=1 Tax=Symbiochloris irregularis TaxID=706552 RepID=A0AAW1NSB3_9CHLO